ncbi:testis-expressed protein 2 isoform X2 [Gouania willdenowi]|uniref:testis-expressed protein 2 isoform X2 n=1 Tax=Gouania willdenowi TaxID=441366 RepID=UPI001055715A|nr:testis-expressed protein 2-like isoform X2 [Gouania willdenowi]
MAERGKQEESGAKDNGSRPLQEYRSRSPVGASSLGSKRHLSRGIVIQLTGTEGEWNSLDDSELIFSLDHDEDYPSISLSTERHISLEEDGQQSKSFHVPLSPSSPGSLGNCSTVSPSFLSPGSSSPTPCPLASLVKSLSTELELKDGSTLRPRPFLTLVKSISTDVSHSEPEVSQSKSDSRLNLHLWKQLTHQKTRSNGDSRTAPPSPSSHSPSGESLKGGFFKMELEDTKRKLSEAMQEPLSNMFSKIMREESGGSPKHQCRTLGCQQTSSRGLGRESSTDTVLSDSPVRNSKKTGADALPVFEWPSVRDYGRHSSTACPVHHRRKHHRNEEQHVCADGDVTQVLVTETSTQTRKWPGFQTTSGSLLSKRSVPQPPHPLPQMSLFCVAVLTYGYFILPLSPYLSGLALGLALGYLLGMLLIRMGSSTTKCPTSFYKPQMMLGEEILTGVAVSSEPEVLKGWMNEIQDYDPETCHPALTHSVYATLEGSCLRLDTPRTNISRRATYDERVYETTFVKSRCFQLTKSKVFLLPSALARKRIWNPKYPICIQLSNGEISQKEEVIIPEVNYEEATDAKPASSSQRPQDLLSTLYLFGRTGREKEEWFRHFLFASMDKETDREKRHKPARCGSRSGEQAQRVTSQVSNPNSRGSSRIGSSEEDAPTTLQFSCISAAPSGNNKCCSLPDYHSYMATCVLAAEESTPLSSPGVSSTEESPTLKDHCTCDQALHTGKSQTSWTNALIGRIFWDFLQEKYWADAVSQKIQKKLSKIKLPYFMNELTLNELDMGSSMPQITATSRPEVNHRGLWVELQLVYTGKLQMTLQTKFNLSKLGKDGGQDAVHHVTDTGSTRCRPVLSVLADSDEESSSAGSSDDEDQLLSDLQGAVGEKGPATATEGAAGAKTGRKILRFVDKIAKSKYFQKAAENEFIKKKFEEMSNTPLLLTVEVQELSGILVVNIPPPPTDRIWYSFCVPPKLDLHVRPKLGEREVTFCHVTEWIEKKLQDEFQKVFVLPNMDDIYLPLMHSAVDSPQASESQRSQSSSTESIERIALEISGAESD